MGCSCQASGPGLGFSGFGLRFGCFRASGYGPPDVRTLPVWEVPDP